MIYIFNIFNAINCKFSVQYCIIAYPIYLNVYVHVLHNYENGEKNLVDMHSECNYPLWEKVLAIVMAISLLHDITPIKA